MGEGVHAGIHHRTEITRYTLSVPFLIFKPSFLGAARMNWYGRGPSPSNWHRDRPAFFLSLWNQPICPISCCHMPFLHRFLFWKQLFSNLIGNATQKKDFSSGFYLSCTDVSNPLFLFRGNGFFVLINLCQSMRSTKKHFVLSLSALSRNTECIYFLSFSAVLQTELPKLENPPELDNSHCTRFGGVCTFCSSLQSHKPAESFWIPVAFPGVTPVKIHSLKHWRVSQAPISSTCWSPR